MQKESLLRKLLAVSAVAVLFSTYGVQAQTTSGAQATSQDTQNQAGKTTREGTIGNTNSWGKDARGATGSQGATGSGTGSAQPHSGNTSGVIGDTNVSGKTTRAGTMGNTNSQGMENRSQGASQSGSSGMSGSAGASGAGNTVSKTDEKILMEMARANIAEIEAAKLAQSKSQNDKVKAFSQQMIDDHSKALADLQQLAQSKGVTLPTEPDAKHKAMAAKLEKMNGEAFDKAYMQQAGLADHKKVHSMLVADQKKAKDAEVKAAAAKMAPAVEQHLKSAQQMTPLKSGATSGK